MPGFSLRLGMVFDWHDGARYRIERMQPGGDILLERLGDGHLCLSTQQALLNDFRQGKIMAETPSDATDKPRKAVYSRPLQDLPEQTRDEVLRRKAYIEALEDQGCTYTPKELRPLIQAVAERLQDPKPPSATTLYRWHRSLKSSDDTRALIPRHDLRGPRTSRQSDRTLDLLDIAIEAAFKASPRATVRDIHVRLVSKIRNENLSRSSPLPVPSLRTLYRLMDKANAYELAKLKTGKAAADKRFRSVKGQSTSSRILERVEIDHTPLDLFLTDDARQTALGRPTLTVVVDHYSRMLLGYHLSFDSPSTASVMRALRHAILPKAHPEPTVPGLRLEHEWPCYGIPDVLVVDNGLEFHSSDLESVAFDLNIRIQYCPKHQPRFKGVVERYLKTVNYHFAHQLPGTSFSKLHERGDYDPIRDAAITFSEFVQIFEKWVVDVYAQQIHRGIGVTPWSRWHNSLKDFQPVLPKDLRLLQQRIGKVTERRLHRDGITLHDLKYNNGALACVLSKYGEGTKLRVAYDPDDLGEIQVWPPDAQDPLTVPALNHAQASGQTLRRHKALQARAREIGRQSEDREAVQRAQQDLMQEIDSLMKSQKQRDRKKAAALKGISSTSPAQPASKEEKNQAPSSPKRPGRKPLKQTNDEPNGNRAAPHREEITLDDLEPMSGFTMIKRHPPEDSES